MPYPRPTLALLALLAASCAEPRKFDPPAPSRADAGVPSGSGGAGGGAAEPDPVDGPAGVTPLDAQVAPEPDPGPTGCQPGFHSCNGACVDGKNPLHCGVSCDPCPTVAGGQATCNGSVCGGSCPANKELCLGECLDKGLPCDMNCKTPGTHNCNGVCVQNTDPNSCGASCDPCPTPPGSLATCDGTACGSRCAPGYKDCSGRCIPEASCCKDSDCPMMGNQVGQCDASTGKCAYSCTPDTKPCGGQCIPSSGCCDDAGCTGNFACQNHTCSTTQCRTGFKTCDGRCIGTGGCCADGDCSNNFACANNVCSRTTCRPGYKICAGKCVPSNACCSDNECASCQKCVNNQCQNQGSNEDRKNECPSATCKSGNCDGNGGCGNAGGNCGSGASCSGQTAKAQDTCVNGECRQGGTTGCNGYGCAGDRCSTTCPNTDALCGSSCKPCQGSQKCLGGSCKCQQTGACGTSCLTCQSYQMCNGTSCVCAPGKCGTGCSCAAGWVCQNGTCVESKIVLVSYDYTWHPDWMTICPQADTPVSCGGNNSISRCVGQTGTCTVTLQWNDLNDAGNKHLGNDPCKFVVKWVSNVYYTCSHSIQRKIASIDRNPLSGCADVPHGTATLKCP